MARLNGDRSPEQIRSSVARRRAVHWILALAVGILLAAATIVSEEGKEIPFGLALAGVAGVLGYALYMLLGWRCPGCNRHLGRSIHPESCPGCGVRF